MKRLLTLAALPLLGLGLCLTAVAMHRAQLRLRISGVKAPGRLAGMAIVRPGRNDLLTGIDTAVTLTRADGERVRAQFQDGQPAALQRASGGAWHVLPTADLARAQLAMLADTARGDAAKVRWILQRERRRTDDPARIVRIEKIETAHGYIGLAHVPHALLSQDGRITPAGAAGARPSRGTIVTHALFDVTDAATLQSNKGDSLCAYVQVRGTVTNTPDKQNFVLYCEPYATTFRPVFTYTAGTQEYARMSHIGRHGGPTLALVLFGPCWVYYDPHEPSSAVLIANPGPVDGAVLAWFSRVCEGALSQWGSGALIVLAGLLCIILGLLQISLALWPSTRLVRH